jgi:hypothetical protein
MEEKPNMVEQADFQEIFSKLDEVRQDPDGATLQVTIDQIQEHTDAISALMAAATELTDPDPTFFTRA